MQNKDNAKYTLYLQEKELSELNDALAYLQQEKRKIDHHNRIVKLKLKPTKEIEKMIIRLKADIITKTQEYQIHIDRYLKEQKDCQPKQTK